MVQNDITSLSKTNHMKTNFTLGLLKVTLILVLAFGLNQGSAQISWDGGGDGTSWEDATNWNPDMVPPQDSLIVFDTSATITGTANGVMHNRINIQEGATVTLDLDLMLGNGDNGEHGIIVGDSCTLILGGGTETRTFTFNVSSNKQCLPAFNGATNARVVISQNAVVNFLQGQVGINIVNPTSSCIIEGEVNIEKDVRNAIRQNGVILNQGTITMTEPGRYGLEMQAGTFENFGSLYILKADNDCINMIGDATFINRGTVDLVAQDSAGTANNAIAIGTDADLATFINFPEGIVTANSGFKDVGRAIYVDAMGTFENFGQVILTGSPDAGARFYNRGTTLNGMGGVFDLTDGRINVNQGALTNTGLLKSTRAGAGVFTSAGTMVTNNGFYDYNEGEGFAIGEGTIMDNGINLNDSASVNIDAMGECTIDLAEAAYTWFEDGNLIDTADATGSLTFPASSLSADPAVLTNGTYPEVTVTVSNVCPEATGTTSVFGPKPDVAQLEISPTLARNGDILNITIPGTSPGEGLHLSIYTMTGIPVKSIRTGSTVRIQVPVNDLAEGMYLISGNEGTRLFRGKFIVGK